MTTITPLTKSLTALSFVLSAPLACDPPGKQIGQLDAGDGEIAASCSDAEEFLVSTMEASEGQHCALLISFDYETFEPLGWNYSCGPGNLDLTEEQASALTTLGGTEISNDDDDRSFIFYTSPADSGGVGWVSNQLGLLFDATIEWNGSGEILYPSEFADPSQLGSDCPAPVLAFQYWPYDLTAATVTYQLPEGHAAALIESLQDTAVVRALEAAFGEHVMYILAYPRTLGEFDPSTAEYIVVFDQWE